MTTKDAARDKQAEITALMATIRAADDMGGAANYCDRYPRSSRRLTRFEDDLRDWGLMYGIAYGLARATFPDEPAGAVAEWAYAAGREAFAQWAGESLDEDATKRRDRVVDELLAELDRSQELAYKAGRYGQIDMTKKLGAALEELAIEMGTITA